MELFSLLSLSLTPFTLPSYVKTSPALPLPGLTVLLISQYSPSQQIVPHVSSHQTGSAVSDTFFPSSFSFNCPVLFILFPKYLLNLPNFPNCSFLVTTLSHLDYCNCFTDILPTSNVDSPHLFSTLQ